MTLERRRRAAPRPRSGGRRARPIVLIAVALTFALVGCSAADQRADSAGATDSTSAATAPPASSGSAVPNTTPAATSLSLDTIPSGTTTGTADPATTGTIIMIKLTVGDLPQAEQFYGTVFGAKPIAQLGDTVHIVTFPNGGPGLVLIKSTDTNKQGAFIIKVTNLDTAKSLALANGATEQGTFAGTPSNQAAHSVDLLDPWNNQIEILQLG